MLATLSLAPGDAKEDAVKKELDKLQGTWVMTAVQWDGHAPAPQDVTSDARCEFTIQSNKYKCGQVGAMYKKAEGYLRIDPSQKPKAMDLSPAEKFKPGETFYQIYELDGDMLRTCTRNKEKMDPKDRPKEFKTAPNSDLWITYWKRKP
jgi:uncharacterized protein (TIGR03067 family)